MKKRIVNALLAGFLLVSATACGKQPAADAAQPQADPTQAYLDTVDVDYAYDLDREFIPSSSSQRRGSRIPGKCHLSRRDRGGHGRDARTPHIQRAMAPRENGSSPG